MRSVGAVSNSGEGTAVAQPSVNIAVVSWAAARWFTGIFQADKQPPSPFHDRHAAILSKLSTGRPMPFSTSINPKPTFFLGRDL
jgi:hypothetical protein